MKTASVVVFVLMGTAMNVHAGEERLQACWSLLPMDSYIFVMPGETKELNDGSGRWVSVDGQTYGSPDDIDDTPLRMEYELLRYQGGDLPSLNEEIC